MVGYCKVRLCVGRYIDDTMCYLCNDMYIITLRCVFCGVCLLCGGCMSEIWV